MNNQGDILASFGYTCTDFFEVYLSRAEFLENLILISRLVQKF
jgi:hypothetical protein